MAFNFKKFIIVISLAVALLIGVAVRIWRGKEIVINPGSESGMLQQRLQRANQEYNTAIQQMAKFDKDFDGISDPEERKYNTNPAVADTDQDGLLDGDEIKIFSTGPNNPDTDGDGVVDGDEVRRGTNPLKK